ncbi:MAG: hypothetical protein N4A71_21760 [Carboxylicivirga sp.]|jgi:hypothetical protein|nr:hypothetical protein [Carboxylicivirga sp.]
MKNSIALFLAMGFVVLTTFSSCNSCSSNKKESIEDQVSFDEISLEETVEEVYYSLPSPEEMIDYIRSNDVTFDYRLLLGINYADSVKTHTEKTILIGAYMANAAYLSVYSKTEFLQEYLLAIKNLADDIGLSTGLTEQQEKIFAELTDNPEAVSKYSRLIYDNIINYVQNYDDGTTLSLIFTGAYIESLYILIELHPEFYENKQSIKRLVEQKIIFDDILALMKSTAKDNSMHVVDQLVGINSSFNKFEVKSSITGVKKNEDGSVQIMGDTQVELSDENYIEFKEKIYASRNNLILNR